jgi:hypothetical protein
MKRQERPPMKQAEKVGSLLKKVFGERGMDERLSRYQAWLIWDKVVGEQIASRARPLRFRKGVLEVQVDHPVWMQQLQMLKPQILDKLNRQLPNAEITDIYLRKAPAPLAKPQQQKEPEPLKWQQIELTDLEMRQIERQLAPLDDQELRNEMRRLLIMQKRLDKSRQGED